VDIIQTNLLLLPSERPLAGIEGPNVPYFVGEEGLAVNTNIYRPFGGSNLSVKKRVSHLSLVQTSKVCGMCSWNFGNKSRNFQRTLNVSPDFAVDIVKACVVLHNFVRERDGYKLQDAVTVTGLEDVPDGQSVGLIANNVRNKVADYFVIDAGAASW